MPAFQYEAINAAGKNQKGVIEADSAKQARHLLRLQGLTPLAILSIQQKNHKITFFSASMSTKELALLTRQLATLIEAGLPLEEVLIAVAEQSEKPKTKSLIMAVRAKVLEGHALATALKDFPSAFSELYCSTVAAGEKSGHLDIVLQRLADYTELQYQMRQKIQHALIYPSLMVLVASGIVFFLLTYVVPKMIAVYNNMGQTLPTMTQVLIYFSTFLKNDGLFILFALLLSIFLFSRGIKKNIKFREKYHRFLLKLPLIGNAIKAANTARFSRTFAILSSAGVSVLEAMNIAGKLITNLPIRYAVEEASQRVREGMHIYLALKQTQFFPSMSIHLIASGEASGRLENMLERAANNQDNDIARLIETSLALFEPAIILLMGAIVLFIVLAILLPIFQLDQLTG